MCYLDDGDIDALCFAGPIALGMLVILVISILKLTGCMN